MTPTPTLAEVEHATGQSLEQAPTENQGRVWDESSSWPVTRLAAWSMTLLLAAGFCIPAASHLDGAPWLLLVGVLPTTVSARALFEALESAAHRASAIAHVAVAIATSLLATTLLMAAGRILGIDWSISTWILTAAATSVTLGSARALRAIEIRVWHELRRIYFVGSEERFRDLANEVRDRNDRQLVGARLLTSGDRPAADPSLLADVVDSRATVLVLDEATHAAALAEPLARLRSTRLAMRGLVAYYEHEFKKIPLHRLNPGSLCCELDLGASRRAYVALRGALEPLLALVLLIVLSPVLLVTAALVRLTCGSPVLYRQLRVGKDGTPFTLIKLRTMTQGAEQPATWASSEAHRVTKVGKHLRRYRLDELPQLWNVVRGDLALVGPRPEQVAIVERLAGEVPSYDARHCIRPGMTGWAQVNLGYEGSVAGALSKLRHDLYYVKHRGPRLDALILWLTLKAVLAGRG